MNSGEARRFLAEWSAGSPTPPERSVRRDYRPVEVYDDERGAWHGVITGWATDNGVELCRLRLARAGEPRWVPYDPERMELLIRSGT
ncbi:hypothetical protein LO772_33215 [Yinghuangia sp. ASG 101]|uniref:hypothetical protein n=1 Tax=Yinghuangia sp. ASG 101 TaxID=2896848 RepID=UPI001E3AA8D6|nr:hypothetical protein [Yinghuangia sp. ASG 101]UGQ11582.1 hypothetical protein LO772_33215 [Yinghuangia sp. ASG 101]